MNSVEALIVKLSQELKRREWKLATAESCTGGGVAFYLTHLAGSSSWFERGFVTYSNLAKEELLGVRATTLQKYGAVSKETAQEMAVGALENSQAQVSLAITGIAGPDGGSLEKPVGTVWFAFSSINKETATHLEIIKGDREQIREKAIQIALEKIVEYTSH